MTVRGQGFWSIIHQRWDFWHSDRCLQRRCTPAAPRGAWPAAKSLQCVWNVPLLWKVSALLRTASWPAPSPKRLPILNSPRASLVHALWINTVDTLGLLPAALRSADAGGVRPSRRPAAGAPRAHQTSRPGGVCERPSVHWGVGRRTPAARRSSNAAKPRPLAGLSLRRDHSEVGVWRPRNEKHFNFSPNRHWKTKTRKRSKVAKLVQFVLYVLLFFC